MTKKELLEQLRDIPMNEQIYLSSDTEGNSIKEIMYVAEFRDGHFEGEKWIDTKTLMVIYPNDTEVQDEL